MRKKSKTKVSTIKRKLWKVVSEYIKLRDGDKCFTCGKTITSPYDRHAGHFIPSAACSFKLRYHEDNIHVQCMKCNVHLGGWGERYAEMMVSKFGENKVAELRKMMHDLTKADIPAYEDLIEKYKEKIKDIDE